MEDAEVLFVPLALGAAIFALGLYFKYHPPDISTVGTRNLQHALWLGSASPIALLLLLALGYIHHHVGSGLSLPALLCALLGNLLNLFAVLLCLSELSVETVFAGLLLIFVQLLWILYAMLAVSSDF
jgi:hypothetical protein